MSALTPTTNEPTIYPAPELVRKVNTDASLADIKANLPFVLRAMAQKDMTSPRQLIGVLATIDVEVPVFRPIEEYGKGGGRHGIFFGRGYVQLTWKTNYANFSKFLGIDAVNNPSLLLKPEIAAAALVWYWCGGSGSPDIRPYAERADWANVRSIINAGKPGRIGICWGVKRYYTAIANGIKHLTNGLDKEALGSLPGNYGLGCADGGSGSNRSFTGLNNPNSPGDAIATALGIHGKYNWRTHEIKATLNVSAYKELLTLRAQQKFKLKNFGKGLDEEYQVESILLTCGDTLDMDLCAYKKDPNAPDPIVFNHDTNAALTNAVAIAPGSGDIPARMLAAAQANRGKSSAAGPGGGNVACAWSVGKYVVLPAGLQKLGAGTYGSDAVRYVVAAILAGRGTEIDRSQAIPGDLWTDGFADLHIGITWESDGNGAKTILSNSSSKAKFSWIGSVESMERWYKGKKSRFFRVTS